MPEQDHFLRDELAPARRGTLHCTTERVARWEDARARLADLGDRAGWVCTTDALSVFHPRVLSARVLSAELVLDERSSLHVRYSGGEWGFTTLREEAEGPMVAYEEQHVSTFRDTPLHYRVWWRLEDRGGVEVWSPFAARLHAFDVRQGG